MPLERILVLDDEPLIQKILSDLFTRKKYAVSVASTLAQAEAMLTRDTFDLIMLDVRLPDGDGQQFLERVMGLPEKPLVVMMTGHGTIESAVGCMRSGAFDEAELERQLTNRGLINRLLAPLTRAVKRPVRMYPIGLLFGLGFDTATEVSLLVLAGGAAAFALPWYAILTLPVLFTAGMCLLDTIDGILMNSAYGWAFSTPVRKVYFNITVTGLSVAVALIIGGQELISVFADKLEISAGPIGWIGQLDLNYVGFVIVGLFVVTWILAVAIWHFGRISDRWNVKAVNDVH